MFAERLTTMENLGTFRALACASKAMQENCREARRRHMRRWLDDSESVMSKIMHAAGQNAMRERVLSLVESKAPGSFYEYTQTEGETRVGGLVCERLLEGAWYFGNEGGVWRLKFIEGYRVGRGTFIHSDNVRRGRIVHIDSSQKVYTREMLDWAPSADDQFRWNFPLTAYIPSVCENLSFRAAVEMVNEHEWEGFYFTYYPEDGKLRYEAHLFRQLNSSEPSFTEHILSRVDCNHAGCEHNKRRACGRPVWEHPRHHYRDENACGCGRSARGILRTLLRMLYCWDLE